MFFFFIVWSSELYHAKLTSAFCISFLISFENASQICEGEMKMKYFLPYAIIRKLSCSSQIDDTFVIHIDLDKVNLKKKRKIEKWRWREIVSSSVKKGGLVSNDTKVTNNKNLANQRLLLWNKHTITKSNFFFIIMILTPLSFDAQIRSKKRLKREITCFHPLSWLKSWPSFSSVTGNWVVCLSVLVFLSCLFFCLLVVFVQKFFLKKVTCP